MAKQVYTIKFSGRRAGALGVNQMFVTSRMGESPDEAVDALYDAFENITSVVVMQDNKVVYERGTMFHGLVTK